jgi:hypothetical protein
MQPRRLILLIFFLIPLTLSAQGLFEDASDPQDSKFPFDLGGYLRSTLFVGEIPADGEGEIKSGYEELSLNLKAEKKGYGDIFTEIRLREGYEFGE